MIGIVERLRFDAIRCEATFSKGVAANITEGADEIERLRKALQKIADLPPADKAVRPVKDHRRIAINALRAAVGQSVVQK
jgi:hypothetical protein